MKTIKCVGFARGDELAGILYNCLNEWRRWSYLHGIGESKDFLVGKGLEEENLIYVNVHETAAQIVLRKI